MVRCTSSRCPLPAAPLVPASTRRAPTAVPSCTRRRAACAAPEQTKQNSKQTNTAERKSRTAGRLRCVAALYAAPAHAPRGYARRIATAARAAAARAARTRRRCARSAAVATKAAQCRARHGAAPRVATCRRATAVQPRGAAEKRSGLTNAAVGLRRRASAMRRSAAAASSACGKPAATSTHSRGALCAGRGAPLFLGMRRAAICSGTASLSASRGGGARVRHRRADRTTAHAPRASCAPRSPRSAALGTPSAPPYVHPSPAGR